MKDMLHEITICAMTEADLEEILAIENDSYPLPWNRDHFLDELKSAHAFPLVALVSDGRIAGYICPYLLLEEGHILNVAVHRDFRGRGVGRLLVERVLRDCRAGGADYISLEVRPSNAAALALYRLLGFVETGRRRKYYENGEDAIIMEHIFEGEEAGDAV
jgi:[ribosomal protein S18]-alanine N-acetyltransferase